MLGTKGMDVCKDMQAKCGTGVEEMQTRRCKKTQNQEQAETTGIAIGDRVDLHVHELIVHWYGSDQKLGRSRMSPDSGQSCPKA